MGNIRLSELIGSGYASFWRSKARYRVVKGSRASKKSKTTAIWYILHLMENPDANLLVVRKFARTLRQSCFAELVWAIERLHFEADWKISGSALEMTRISTGQKIIFRGLDDAQKITSISVSHGALCWVWFEEAYELADESEFNKLDLSIRGQLPKGLFKQLTLTLNPWNESSWIKRRFFDTKSDDIFTLTTTWECNEWLDASDRRIFEQMRATNPRRYRVEGLGEWGSSEGLIYTRFEVEDFPIEPLKANRDLKAWYGLDFGFTDPTAFVGGFVDKKNNIIWVAFECYQVGKTNQEVAALLKSDIGLRHEVVYCDAAEPKSIEELNRAGINAIPSPKGSDSVRFGINVLQNFDIKIHAVNCPNCSSEIRNYAWAKDRVGRITEKPEHDFSHTMDAMRYGVIPLVAGRDSPWRSRKMFA